MLLPTIFDSCIPRPIVLSGNLPDSIFAADLWDVITGRAHPDYQDPISWMYYRINEDVSYEEYNRQ